MVKRVNWLVAGIVAGILSRIGAALLLGDQIEPLPGIFDQISYHTLAQSLLAGNGYQFPVQWYPFTPPNTPTAHWSFVYPLYLAGVYAIFGEHPLAARLIQVVIGGGLMMWGSYRLAKRFFGESAGIFALLATAFYGYFIYHNAALMTETFYIVGVLLSFDLAYQMAEEKRVKVWWQLGLVMGMTVLIRQLFLLFVPILLGWIGWRWGKKEGWRALGGVFGTVLLCVLPWTWRNYQQYGSFLLLNSNSGYALYTSTHPDHGPVWQHDYIAPIPPELQPANEAELDRALSRRAIAAITQDLGRFLLLSLSKISTHFRFLPTSDSGWLSNLVRTASFGLYLPFMLTGIWMCRHSWRRLTPIFLFALLFTAIHLLSWPSARYRFPIDALAMVFVGLVWASLYKRWFAQ